MLNKKFIRLLNTKIEIFNIFSVFFSEKCLIFEFLSLVFTNKSFKSE